MTMMTTLRCGVALGVALAAATVNAAVVVEAPTGPPGIAEGSDIVVTATKANQIAPVTASLQATQPQAIVSRSFIEDSLPATADFNAIALISPSVSNFGNNNGVGLSESKAQIRGFQDGEYNVTYDEVPFGDQNDPSHHSNTFFPSNTIETLVVERGPGNASNLGISTFGGSINLFSRETREDFGGELKGIYGSYNTYLVRGLVNSGAIKSLGGTEILVSGQYGHSDGRLTYEKYKAVNVFGKAVIPLGPDVKLTLIATYNDNHFNQPDNDGATLAQVALFGNNFSLTNDPTTPNYFGYNTTHKTTDFEIVRLDANLSSHVSFDNRAYTYFYDNETLSGNDVTLFGDPVASLKGNVVTLAPGAAKVPGVPGYTKSNKYRVYGDIAKLHYDFGFGTLTFGGWMERSDTFRQQTDVNLATGAFDYREKAVTSPSGVVTPQYVRFNQNSAVNHDEEFAELELRPFEGLKITPGIKRVAFERSIVAPYNQGTRYAQNVANTYGATLPFATVNYTVTPMLAVYGQFAKGFLIPPLSQLYIPNPSFSPASPQKSTNYQGGAVYHGSRLSLDADYYYIDFTNKFVSVLSPVAGVGNVFVNVGGAIYRGFEGQATYALDNGIAVFGNASRNFAKTNNPGAPRTQISNAPAWTAAAGALYKHGPIKFSLIDKLTGVQYGSEGEILASRIGPYNTAIVAASYQYGPLRVGVEVTDLFDSTKVVHISGSQFFFQPGRSVQGDVTFTF